MKEIFARANKNGYKWVLENSGDYAESWEDMVAECVLFGKSPPPSLNDLLADEGFVKALFGENGYCFVPADVGSCSEACRFGVTCMYKKKAYLGHCHILSIIFDQQEKIKYIKEHML